MSRIKLSVPGVKYGIAALVLGVAGTGPTLAGDGIYIGGALGNTNVEQFLSRNTGTNIPTSPDTGPANGPSVSAVNEESGFSGAILAGYRKDLPNDFFIAGEVFYSVEDVETQVLNNVLVNDFTLNSTHGIDVKSGFQVTDRFAIYGLSGITGYDFDSDVSYTFAPPTEAVSDVEYALTYGGGIEVLLTPKWSTFTEFRISNDVEFDTPKDRGGIVSENELNFSVIRSGLKYFF